MSNLYANLIATCPQLPLEADAKRARCVRPSEARDFLGVLMNMGGSSDITDIAATCAIGLHGDTLTDMYDALKDGVVVLCASRIDHNPALDGDDDSWVRVLFNGWGDVIYVTEDDGPVDFRTESGYEFTLGEAGAVEWWPTRTTMFTKLYVRVPKDGHVRLHCAMFKDPIPDTLNDASLVFSAGGRKWRNSRGTVVPVNDNVWTA